MTQKRPEICDELDPHSVRQLGASRFQRNQRLLYEIFSESCVPDLRSIVTNPRMHMLKRQVHSLTMHQKKLENELEQLEEKFQAKKRCFMQNTEEFNQKLQQLSGPPASAQKYQEMVAKATDQILEQYKAYTASISSSNVVLHTTSNVKIETSEEDGQKGEGKDSFTTT